MKTTYITYLSVLVIAISLMSCGGNNESAHAHGENDHGHEHTEATHSPESAKHMHEAEVEVVHFSKQQFNDLEMKVDTLVQRNNSTYVETNGMLEVPPQNEATVTAIIGANISTIKVIEGDQVNKGQTLATINHPDLIQIQTDYITNWNDLKYLEQEFLRQKKLYEEEIGSGKEFQRTKSEYNSKKATVNGLEAQLKLLGLSVTQIQEGNIAEVVAIKSPIDGYVRLVEVKIGQYVSPQTELFEIVNIEHIHADFMVFEKDIAKVKKGQKIRFRVESTENELEASVYSVGKNFEQNPKAIHLHAEIEVKEGILLPGMYVRGQILVTDSLGFALPEAAVIKEAGKAYVFSAKSEANGAWSFTSIEVIAGSTNDGWTEIRLLSPLAPNTKFAWNNAYYLMAELRKGEVDGDHSH